MNVVIAIVMGSLFGAALYYSGAANSKNIISMLCLEDLTLMKIILFAIGYASVHLSIFGLLKIIDISHLDIKPLNLGVIIGGLLFGIGFGFIGTCPGTCIAALGCGGFRKAIATVLGGLFGALIFSFSFGLFDKLGIFKIFYLGSISLFNISEKFDYLIKAGFWGLLITGMIFLIIAKVIPFSGIKYKGKNEKFESYSTFEFIDEENI